MSDEAMILSSRDLRLILQERCDMAGGQRAFGQRYGISQSIVSEVLANKRPMPEAIIQALGFIAVTRYVPVKRAAPAGAVPAS